jgi:hypothetical protein
VVVDGLILATAVTGVASNNIPVGRQQNRRVELVVSGESIGRPNPDTSALRRR